MQSVDNVAYMLVRFISLPKLGDMGLVRLYLDRFMSTITTRVPILKFNYMIKKPRILEQVIKI
jgi:hypothetical protein